MLDSRMKTCLLEGELMNRVYEIRVMMKMTQETFAKFCDISRISIARYEAGAPLSRKSAQKIARACSVSIDYLLNEDAIEKTSRIVLKESASLSREEKALLKSFRSMASAGKKRAIQTLDELQIVYPRSKKYSEKRTDQQEKGC